eukprot:jgi/Hompol1/2693/HPOL_006129-RA
MPLPAIPTKPPAPIPAAVTVPVYGTTSAPSPSFSSAPTSPMSLPPMDFSTALPKAGANNNNVLNIDTLLRGFRATRTLSIMSTRFSRIAEIEVFEEEWVADDDDDVPDTDAQNNADDNDHDTEEEESIDNVRDLSQRVPQSVHFDMQQQQQQQFGSLRRNRVTSSAGDLPAKSDTNDRAAIAKATLLRKMQEISNRRQQSSPLASISSTGQPVDSESAQDQSYSVVIPPTAAPAAPTTTPPTLALPSLSDYLDLDLFKDINSSLFDTDTLTPFATPSSAAPAAPAAQLAADQKPSLPDAPEPVTDMPAIQMPDLHQPSAVSDRQQVAATYGDSSDMFATNLYSQLELDFKMGEFGDFSNLEQTEQTAEEQLYDAEDDQQQQHHEHEQLHDPNALICAFCEEPIEDRAVQLLGRFWHREHSCCHECRRPIGVDNFVEIDSFLYCEDHYILHNGNYLVRREADRSKKTPVEQELSKIKQT